LGKAGEMPDKAGHAAPRRGTPWLCAPVLAQTDV